MNGLASRHVRKFSARTVMETVLDRSSLRQVLNASDRNVNSSPLYWTNSNGQLADWLTVFMAVLDVVRVVRILQILPKSNLGQL